MSLSVDRLTVRYPQLTAVREVSFELTDGEVLAVLGPSGSGKSTLLRAISGLEPEAEGAVAWDGWPVTHVPVHQRGFGLVFQDGQLFPHRDVAGNVEFGLRMRAVARVDRARRVSELLELTGLTGYEHRRVTELSGGQAQRVALARALAPRPKLLLMDEPLSGLDASLREQLAVELAELLRSTKTTALLVTHDQEEAFSLADRVAIIDRGHLRQIGAVDDVWRRPVDETVAAFLGVTTTLTARVADGVLRCPVGELAMPDEREGTVRIGLRPNALRRAHTGVAGTVVSSTHRRDHARLRVRLDGVERPCTVDAVVAVLDDVHRGDQVRLELDTDAIAIIG